MTGNKRRFLQAIFLLAVPSFLLASCGGGSSTPPSVESSNSDSGVSIRISSFVSEVAVGGTITIRVLVTGTASRDVTWSSANTAIATVAASGEVTGVAAGETDITATLVAFPAKTATQHIKVSQASVPTSIEVTGGTAQTGWVGEDQQLALTFAPENADKRVSYVSSDPDTASVDANGLVTFKKKGTAKVSISSVASSSVATSVDYTVNEGAFWTNKGGYSAYFDYSHQGDADPYLKTNFTMTSDNLPTYAWFRMTPALKYYAEATIAFDETTTDPWTRVGIGSATTDTDTRAFYFSDKEGQKTTVLDFPVEFGGNQNQSTVWRVNGIYSIDKTNFKLGILRDGDNYYYTINDKLYWFENNPRFTGAANTPLIIGKDVSFTIFDPHLILDETALNAKIASAAYQDSYFSASSLAGQVVYDSANDAWTFNNNNREDWNNVCMGQQAAKPYGDKGLAKGNFTIDFDISGYSQETDNVANSIAGISLRRYDTWEPMMDTFGLAGDHLHFRNWNLASSDNAFVTGKLASTDSATFTAVASTESHHIKIARTISGARALFHVTMDGNAISFGSENEGDYRLNYIGKYLLYFGANDCKCTISHMTIVNS